MKIARVFHRPKLILFKNAQSIAAVQELELALKRDRKGLLWSLGVQDVIYLIIKIESPRDFRIFV